MGVARTLESVAIKNIVETSIFCQTQITPNNCDYATHIYFLLCTGNKRPDDICHLVKPKHSATNTLIRPVLNPAADSRQWIGPITVMMNTVMLTINTYELKALIIKAKLIKKSVVTNTERRQRRQGWKDSWWSHNEMKRSKTRKISNGQTGRKKRKRIGICTWNWRS